METTESVREDLHAEGEGSVAAEKKDHVQEVHVEDEKDRAGEDHPDSVLKVRVVKEVHVVEEVQVEEVYDDDDDDDEVRGDEVHVKVVEKSQKDRKSSPASSLPTFKFKQKEKNSNCYYGIRIVTASYVLSGTNNTGIYVTLIGKKATEKIYLLNTFHFIKSNSYFDILIETENLGEVSVVMLGIHKNILHSLEKTSWFVECVSVLDWANKTTRIFPCYHSIEDGKYVSMTSKTSLYKDIEDNSLLVRERKEQLKDRQKAYQWLKFPGTGVPSGIKGSMHEVPEDENFVLVKAIDFTKTALEAFMKLKTGGIGKGHQAKHLHDFTTVARFIQPARLRLDEGSRWQYDVEFGRQMLNGVNPYIIEKCTKLPANFPVTHELVGPFLTRGLTLEQEMESGHIYICNLEFLDDLPSRKGCYVCAPICLLYVNSSRQLVPIAIQLKQGVSSKEKNELNPIFVPSDNLYDWLLAKMYYQSMHGQYHQLMTHYIGCHATMEAYCVGTMRNLPDSHPVNKLLRPHFRFTIAINIRARSSLINDGGVIDLLFGMGGAGKREVFARASGRYNVNVANIKKYAKDRGVDDSEKLPGYYFRDDGIKTWNLIEEFVSKVIGTFYATDGDVQNDPELKNWVTDIYTNGFPGDGNTGQGFPSSISSKSELVEVCTMIIFTGSCLHSAVNFGQYEIYGYSPNAPLAFKNPPPTKKGKLTYEKFLKCLLDVKSVTYQVAMTYLLSQYSDVEVMLGNYPFQRFTEKDVLTHIKEFQKSLKQLSTEIDERNKTLEIPYVHLKRERITNSITI